MPEAEEKLYFGSIHFYENRSPSRIYLRGHTPKQGFVPANPNDFIGRLVTL